MQTIPTTIYVDEATAKNLKQISEEMKISRSGVIRILINEKQHILQKESQFEK
jgi:predicted transcriptional regulator